MAGYGRYSHDLDDISFFITINNDQIISSIFTSFMFFIGSFSIGHTVCIGGGQATKINPMSSKCTL